MVVALPRDESYLQHELFCYCFYLDWSGKLPDLGKIEIWSGNRGIRLSCHFSSFHSTLWEGFSLAMF